MDNLDKIVDELFNKITELKQRVELAENKPTYKTNLMFKYPNTEEKVSLHVPRKLSVIKDIVTTLVRLKADHETSNKILELEETEFNYLGYSFDEWIFDLKTKASQITITEEKEKLAKLEARLSSLLSPEQIRKKEIELLSRELGGM